MSALVQCQGECGREVERVDEHGCCEQCSVVGVDGAEPTAPDPASPPHPTSAPTFVAPEHGSAIAWAPITEAEAPLAPPMEAMVGSLKVTLEGRDRSEDVTLTLSPQGFMRIVYAGQRHMKLDLNDLVRGALQRLVAEGRIERAAARKHRSACPVTPVFMGRQALFDGRGVAQARCCSCGAEVPVTYLEAEAESLDRGGPRAVVPPP